MQKLKRLFLSSEFAKNVLTLMTGTALAQAIPIAASPILTRIYAPEDFGVFALYLAFSGLIAAGATGTYEQAIMLPREEGDATNIVALAILIAFGLSLLTLLAVSVLNRPVARLLKNPEISAWLYLTPVTAFLTGAYQTFNLWSNRKKQYRRIAVSRISQSAAATTANLGMGFGGLGAAGLVIGGIFGQTVGTGILGWGIWEEDREKAAHISRAKLAEQAKKYRDFPRFNLVQIYLDSLRDNGIIFLISYFFDATILGFYAFAVRILKTPLALIGSSVGQVFYQQAAHAHNSGQALWPLLKKVLLRLTLMSLPVFAALVVVGPMLFRLVFGHRWEEAGTYAQILAPWLLVNFIASPISQIPLVLGKQKSFLLLGSGYNALIPLTFISAAVVAGSIRQILACVSAAGTLYLLGMIVWVAKISQQGKQYEGV